MHRVIRGYSREMRWISAAVFIPLFVLFLVLVAAYDGNRVYVSGFAACLLISLLLLTPLWYAFYPVLFVVIGAFSVYLGCAFSDWIGIGEGVLWLLGAAWLTRQIARSRRGR